MSDWISQTLLSGNTLTLMPVLLDAAIKGVVLTAIAYAVVKLMRRASAAHRHVVLFLAMLSLLALPAFSAMLPQWEILPRWFGTPKSVVIEPIESAETPIAPSVPLSMESASYEPSPVHAPITPAATEMSTIPAAEPARKWSPRQLLAWLLPIWLLGTLAALSPLMLGTLVLWRRSRKATRVTDGRSTSLLRELSDSLRLRSRVTLLHVDRHAMPLAWGIIQPKIMLPWDADDWPDERLRGVLIHELAHIKHRDCLAQFVSHVACALHWFNPFAWMIRRRMVLEREQACDDIVLNAGLKSSTYAQQLLEIASGPRAGWATGAAAIAMARASSLEGRLLAILDTKRSRRALTRSVLLLGLVVAIGIAVPLATLRAQGYDTKPIEEHGTEDASMSGSRTAFPGGGTVEIVAVSNHPSKGRQWWQPDGESIDNPPIIAPRGRSTSTTRTSYEIIYRTNDFPKESNPNWIIRPGNAMTTGVRLPDGRDASDLIWSVAQFPKDAVKGNVKFGASTGTWQKVAANGVDGQGSMGSNSREGNFSVSFTSGYEVDGKAAVTVTHTIHGEDTDVRVVAIDDMGREHTSSNRGSSGCAQYTQLTTRFDLPLARVNHFRFQTRPIHWVEFKNISLKPGHETDVQVVVQAADTDPSSVEQARGPAVEVQEAPWDEAVEGVQVRLRADKTEWSADEVVTFKADVRNQGARNLFALRAQSSCEIEFDGIWYTSTVEVLVRRVPFGPGQQYDNISITLPEHWETKTKRGVGKRLGLKPGKHTIRVAFTAQPNGGGNPVRATSNPVEITILPAKSVKKTAVPPAAELDIGFVGVCPDAGDLLYGADGKRIGMLPGADMFLGRKYWNGDELCRRFVFDFPKGAEPMLLPILGIRNSRNNIHLGGMQHGWGMVEDNERRRVLMDCTFDKAYAEYLGMKASVDRVDVTIRYYHGPRQKSAISFTGPFKPNVAISEDADQAYTLTPLPPTRHQPVTARFQLTTKQSFESNEMIPLAYSTSGKRYLVNSGSGRSGSSGADFECLVLDVPLDQIASITFGEKPFEKTFQDIPVVYPDQPERDHAEYLDKMAEVLGLTNLSPEELAEYRFKTPLEAIKVMDIVRGGHTYTASQAIRHERPRVDLTELEPELLNRLRNTARRWAKAPNPYIRADAVAIGLKAQWPEFVDLAFALLNTEATRGASWQPRAYAEARQAAARALYDYREHLSDDDMIIIKDNLLRKDDPATCHWLRACLLYTETSVATAALWELACVEDDRPWLWLPAIGRLSDRRELTSKEPLSENLRLRLLIARGAHQRDDSLPPAACTMLTNLLTPELQAMDGSVFSRIYGALVEHVDRTTATAVMVDFLRRVKDHSRAGGVIARIAMQINLWHGVNISGLGSDVSGGFPDYDTYDWQKIAAETINWYNTRSAPAAATGNHDEKR